MSSPEVYDLISPLTRSSQPSPFTSALWTLGTAILHSGLVVDDREYAYGGHNIPKKTGVYYTRPGQEPPGAKFRCEISQGYTNLSEEEVEDEIRMASAKFQGTGYNLLSQNCNHFTNYLSQRLTGKSVPAWVNRAAGIGIALPCVVPKEWLAPPDYETADGDLVHDEDEEFYDGGDEDDERRAMMRLETFREPRTDSARASYIEEYDREFHNNDVEESDSMTARLIGEAKSVKDTSGRAIPASERAPVT